MTVLFNVNTRSAYEAGCYAGSHRLDHVLRFGDFGLGALNHNDGDLVIEGGRAYRTAFDGSTAQLPPEATTSYATVIPFFVDRGFEVAESMGQAEFEGLLAASIPLANRIWALRIRGLFTQVTSGASRAQTLPYRPLAEVLPTYNFQRHDHAIGTLVAFHSPAYLSGIGVVGPHYHWLSDDHAQGGHVTGFTIEHVVVEACEATGFAFELPDSKAFRELDLTPRP
jgi:acetolactate decarboxylase